MIENKLYNLGDQQERFFSLKMLCDRQERGFRFCATNRNVFQNKLIVKFTIK